MSRNILPSARLHVHAFSGAAILAGGGYLILALGGWRSPASLHASLGAAATILALVVGAIALMRYWDAKNGTFLLIGLGYLATVPLDGYYTFVTSIAVAPAPSELSAIVPWSWLASRLLLSVLIGLSWLVWRREKRLGEAGRIGAPAIYGAVSASAAAAVLLLVLVPTAPVHHPDLFLHRPWEIVPAVFFLMALVGYLRGSGWKRPAFEHYLSASLILAVVGQGLIATAPDALFGDFFDAAHALKVVSHGVVLIGLLSSMRAIVRREQAATRMAARVYEALEERVSTVAHETALLKAIVDALGLGYVLIDSRLRIVASNRRFQDFLGLKSEQAEPGTPIEEIIRDVATQGEYGPGDIEEVVAEKLSAMSRMKPGCHEQRRPDGTVLEVRRTPVKGGKLIVTYDDITARKQADRKLREREAFLSTVFDTVPDPIVTTDGQGTIVTMNAATEKVFGYSPMEIIGRPITLLIPSLHPAPGLGVGQPLPPEARPLNTAKGEVEGVRRNGTDCVVDMTFGEMAVRGSAFYVGVLRDVTEHKRAEEAKLRLAEALEHASEGISYFDADDRLVFFNDKCKEIYTESKQAIYRGAAFEDILRAGLARGQYPDAVGREEIWLADRLAAHRAAEAPVEQHLCDGRWVRITEHHTRDGGTVCVRADITAFKAREATLLDREVQFKGNIAELEATKEQLEAQGAELAAKAEELALASRRAEAATRTKSQFLAAMSREFRAPMHGAAAMCELLLNTDVDPKQRQYAETALDSIQVLVAVLDDFHDLARLEAGKLTLEMVDFSIADVVDGVVRLLGTQRSERGIDFFTLVAPDVPEVVRGDPSCLRQVLQGLVAGALAHIDAESVAVEVTVAESGEDEVTARFEISVSEVAGAAATRGEFPDRFAQAGDDGGRRYPGTGIVLPSLRQLVDLMDGELDRDSAPGRHRFRFTARLGTVRSEFRPRPPRPAYLAGLRVLLVDPRRLNRETMAKLFAARGVKAACVAERAALARLDKALASGRPFDVAVVIDHGRGTDGLSLCRRIREKHDGTGLRLIIVSANDLTNRSEELSAIAIARAMLKPISPSALFREIAIACGRAVSEDAYPNGGAAAESSPESKRLPCLNILLAEDNTVNQTIAALMLGRMGHQVDVVADGRDAVEAVRSEAYDLVIMDMRMPGMGGIEATALIRRLDSPAAQIPIIGLAAKATPETKGECVAAGMNDCISKPIGKDELGAAIRRRLDRQSTVGEIAPPTNPEATVEEALAAAASPRGAPAEARALEERLWEKASAAAKPGRRLLN